MKRVRNKRKGDDSNRYKKGEKAFNISLRIFELNLFRIISIVYCFFITIYNLLQDIYIA